MSFFSKSCEYALRAVFYISRSTQEGKKVGVKEIAENIQSPEAFLGKILQRLSKEGIIQSAKGPNGGFFVTEENIKRPISDIVLSIDGKALLTGCGLGLKECSEDKPCPLHHYFKDIREQLKEMLDNITIDQFNNDLIKGKVMLRK
ncbi:MAG TPA: Rrf2 family transcriptional regulator [Sphingobacterium sp.]|nr:Rrf2 family transcriptional regulator [Sphingobacterium sp.]